MKQWFVSTTKPSQEARAAIELTKQDFRVFLPIHTMRPMFPGYIFVQFDRDVDNWGVIKSTRGCVDLLKNGFVPANVRDDVMEAIMSYRPPVEVPETEAVFTMGQPVKIVDGPCAGLQGLFVADKKSRVMALLEIMGKRVEIPRRSVRAA